jgi:hypothetical protein
MQSKIVGHDLSHIKGIIAVYYPSGNQSAFSQTKMRYSSSKLCWEVEIEP